MNILHDPLSTSFYSVVLGSFLLLLGAECPKARRFTSIVLGLAAALFAALTFWQMAVSVDRALGAFLVTSIALSNFGIVLMRISNSKNRILDSSV